MIKVSDILVFLDEEKIAYKFFGDSEQVIKGFSSFSAYRPGTMTWLKKRDGTQVVSDKNISLLVVQEGVDTDAVNKIATFESKRAFFSAIEHFFGDDDERPKVGANTWISPKVKIADGVRIGYNCTIDGDITIGAGTKIWDNVTIVNKVLIGENCEIHSGARIGHDGFAYTETPDGLKTMVKHFGGVRIEEDVFIGANVVIARGTIDDTVISRGCKIASSSDIGHNCMLGKGSTVISGTTLYGSVSTGENVYIAASVIMNQLHLGSNSYAAIGSVVLNDVKEYTQVIGNPARVIKNLQGK
jgi:UDP-3-O-[3-hydroxymyristoyl] glucosamine N-acyltransferase